MFKAMPKLKALKIAMKTEVGKRLWEK